MAGDTDNPRIWVGADAYTAPLTSTIPDDVTTEWDAAWEALGLLSDDGGTESRDEDTSDHYAWGGVLVRRTRSKHTRTITITALEENDTVFGLVEPGSTANAAGGITTRYIKPPTPNIRMFGLELVDGDVVKRRIIPRGEVTAVGDVSLSDSDMTAYELTITCYPTTVDGEDDVLYLDVSNDPQAAPTS